MVSSCTWGFCHFVFLPVLSLAWELWEQWTEQKSNCSHALLSVGISLLTLLTTILPWFIYSCDDAAQCKIGQCFSTFRTKVHFVPWGGWCWCAAGLCPGAAAGAVFGSWLIPSCPFARPAAFQEQVCCVLQCPAAVHTPYFTSENASSGSQKSPFMPLALQGCKLVPSCSSTSLLCRCTRLGSIFLSLTVCMCCCATVAS